MTSCRSEGFHTNGNVLCTPSECSKYQNVSQAMDYFQDELHVTYNMNGLSNSSTPIKAVVTEFSSASDPRQIYSVLENKTAMVTTEEFFEYCELYGPCYDGRFLNRIILFYSAREFPLLIMTFEESVVYIAVKYDPREFVWVPRLNAPKCTYDHELKLMQCQSPSGKYYWRRLWEASLS